MCSSGPESDDADMQCQGTFTCPVDDQQRWRLYGLTETNGWEYIGSRCFTGTPEPFVPPTVTPGDVLNALRRIGLPKLETHIQPQDKTLVNLDTIFHTNAEPVDLDLTLLGQAVDVIATPTTYHWHFGDGTSTTTDTPGAAYPSRAVTHRYLDADTTVHPHLEVTYTARFRVGTGGWQDIDGTVTTTGPTTPLRVVEAIPVLSGDHP